MSKTPVTIPGRPFALEPVSGIMLPDGIFDVAVGRLRLACHVTNDAPQDMHDVVIYIEGIGDTGIYVADEHRNHVYLGTLRAYGTVTAHWDIILESHVSAGKTLVSFKAYAQSYEPVRVLTRIFVSKTSFDPANGSYRVSVPEGECVASIGAFLGPSVPAECNRRDEHRLPPYCPLGPWIPTQMTIGITRDYDGQYGPLPFGDPLWKIIAWVIAALASIGAAIAAATGNGTANWFGGFNWGESEGAIDPCIPKPPGGLKNLATPAGALSAIASAAIVVGLRDKEDPILRGQRGTGSPSGPTSRESLEFAVDYKRLPASGPYDVGVKWQYKRQLRSGEQLGPVTISEAQRNQDYAVVQFEIPADVHAGQPHCVASARLVSPGGQVYRGPAALVQLWVVAPNGETVLLAMHDNGQNIQDKAGEGLYATEVHFGALAERLGCPLVGTWLAGVLAQDVNGAPPNAPSDVAKDYIGGRVIASPFAIKQEQDQCKTIDELIEVLRRVIVRLP